MVGVTYESYVPSLDDLFQLPSPAWAPLALMAFNTEFSIMALIGGILLIAL